MSRIRLAFSVVGLAVAGSAVLAGCSGGSASSSSSTPPTSSSALSSPSETPSPSQTTSATGPTDSASPSATTTIDPCQLLPADEASALAGVTYGAGTESVNAGGGKMCTYGANTTTVTEIIVGQGGDPTTIKADMSASEQEILANAPAGTQFSPLPGLGDGGDYVTGSMTVSGTTVSGSAIDAYRGSTWFTFSVLSAVSATPDLATLQAQAQKVLGRLP